MRPLRQLQPLARARLRSLGAVGESWAASLPRVLDELAAEWSLTWGRPLPGGSASFVVAATTADGDARVVKVPMPEPEPDVPGLAGETRTLAAARGRGYVVLHADDAERGALLLEPLGPSLQQLSLDPEPTLDILADTARQAWRLPLDTAPPLPRGADKATTLRAFVLGLADRLPGACDPRVLAHAIDVAEQLAAAYDPDACVVVHGDLHPGNALRVARGRPGAESGFVLVDPDGFRADPAYDLGVALRDWTGPLGEAGTGARALLGGYADRLAARTGVDRQRIWEWAFLERVSTGLHAVDLGATDIGGRLLGSATMLVV
jgi:streptomycin 6-kinase